MGSYRQWIHARERNEGSYSMGITDFVGSGGLAKSLPKVIGVLW